MINKDEIIKLFAVDTFICAVNGYKLEQYQINKHWWSKEQFNEYIKIYQENIGHITVQ